MGQYLLCVKRRGHLRHHHMPQLTERQPPPDWNGGARPDGAGNRLHPVRQPQSRPTGAIHHWRRRRGGNPRPQNHVPSRPLRGDLLGDQPDASLGMDSLAWCHRQRRGHGGLSSHNRLARVALKRKSGSDQPFPLATLRPTALLVDGNLNCPHHQVLTCHLPYVHGY